MRYLHFGSDWIQGAMRIARPYALELEYTREMMAALLLRPDPAWPRNALLVGLGAGSLTKFLYRHVPQAQLKVVEINPELPAVARHFFRLPDDMRRLRIVIGCGAEFVAQRGEKYDLVLVDGFDRHARSGPLDSDTFYRNCRERLSQQGVMAVNLLGRSRGFRGSFERIVTAFDERAMVFPSNDEGNAIAFGAAGETIRLSLEELGALVGDLKRATGLNLKSTLARLAQSRTCRGGMLVL